MLPSFLMRYYEAFVCLHPNLFPGLSYVKGGPPFYFYYRSPNVVFPNSLVMQIQEVYPPFRGYAQHDAQEFFHIFLNRLHDELKTSRSGMLKNERSPSKCL